MHKVLKVGSLDLDQVSVLRLSVLMLTASTTGKILRCELPLVRKIALKYVMHTDKPFTPSEATTVCVTVEPEREIVTFAYGPVSAYVFTVQFNALVDNINRMVGAFHHDVENN